MKDLFKGVKGHFKAERLDAFDNVIDTPVDDHNMIMTTARISMAEIFAHLTNVDLSNAFYFGTLGHKEPNIYLPKDSGDGFTKDRDRMFSSVSDTVYNLNDVIDPICKNDIIQYNHVYKDANGGVHNELKLLRYKGVNKTQFVLTADEISEMEVIPKKPYFVKVPFTFPGKNKVDGSQNVPEGYNYSVQITQQDTSVTFVIVIPMTEGNAQYVNNDDYGIPTSVFTEAALYINGRIFSLKTFQGLTKDDSIKVRITWTITF